MLDEAAALLDDPARLAAAGASTLGGFLTAHVRLEHLCDCYLGDVIRACNFEALCCRLAVLLERGPAILGVRLRCQHCAANQAAPAREMATARCSTRRDREPEPE